MSFSVPGRVFRIPQLKNGQWLQLACVLLGFTNLQSPGQHSWWEDPFWKLYLHLDDGCDVLHGSSVTPLPAMRLAMLPAWQSWRLRPLRPVRHIYLAIDAPLLPASLSRREFAGVQLLPETAAMRSLVAQLIGIQREMAAGQPMTLALSCRVQAVAYAVFAPLLARISELTPPPAPVRAVLDHLERDLAGDCHLRTLARVASVGVKTLNAAFRLSMGVSAAAYVRERRIARAADLLLSSEWSLERIAQESGFPNRHYLTRVFTRRMGMAPARYRDERRLGAHAP